MSSPPAEQASGPPYGSQNAGLGGLPNTSVDAPITSVFLVLFTIGAALNMAILQINLRRGHKFLASGALFGFCMARITTCTMRLVWSTHQTSVPIAIAANIFVNAGVIIIIIINIIFAQRILRASHPKLGWHRITHFLFLAYYVSILLLLAALITSIVQQSYTLDGNIRRIDRDIQLVGATYNAFAAFAPIPLLIIGVVLPKIKAGGPRGVDKFGTGRFRTKIFILILSSLLITLGAGFRTGAAYAPRPASDPAWYHGRAPFYCFNLGVEIIVIFLYVAVRVDRRFHVPNGSSARKNYSLEGGKMQTRVVGEDEFLDDFRPNGGAEVAEEENAQKWEKNAEAELESGVPEPSAARLA